MVRFDENLFPLISNETASIAEKMTRVFLTLTAENVEEYVERISHSLIGYNAIKDISIRNAETYILIYAFLGLHMRRVYPSHMQTQLDLFQNVDKRLSVMLHESLYACCTGNVDAANNTAKRIAEAAPELQNNSYALKTYPEMYEVFTFSWLFCLAVGAQKDFANKPKL
jgi:hypothetical protein